MSRLSSVHAHPRRFTGEAWPHANKRLSLRFYVHTCLLDGRVNELGPAAGESLPLLLYFIATRANHSQLTKPRQMLDMRRQLFSAVPIVAQK